MEKGLNRKVGKVGKVRKFKVKDITKKIVEWFTGIVVAVFDLGVDRSGMIR